MTKFNKTIGDTLHYLKMRGAFYCKSDLFGDWGILMPSMPNTSMFHIVTEGECIIEQGTKVLTLKAGDFVFIPKGEGHIIRSKENESPVELFSLPSKKISDNYEVLEVGQEGEKTTMLCGVVKLEHPSAEFLIESMPSLVNLECSKSKFSDWMSHTVRLISIEAETRQVGGETILTRLADVLIIQVLRHWIESEIVQERSWLMAIKDEKIGKSLSLIHENPQIAWTLKDLGKEVGMSRTSFALRFSHLVGQSMFKYLTKWRMNLAAMKLREGEKITPEFMENLGYKSESAFRRTFKTVHGENVSEYNK